MKLLKKFPIFILALSVFIISVLTLTQPIAPRPLHRLLAQFIPVIPARIAFLTPQVSPQTSVKPVWNLNQVSATLASTWTTDRPNTAITGCNCPQCRVI